VELVGYRQKNMVVSLGVTPSPITIRWGVGSGAIGDTQALCSVTAPRGMALELQSATFASHRQAVEWQGGVSSPNTRWDLDCGNMGGGIQWLANNTEIEGMDQSFASFAQDECGRSATAWLMPLTDRPHPQFVAVRAVASELTQEL